MLSRKVHIGSIAYTSGQKATLEIPTDGVAVAYVLRLTYTVTNGSSAAVGPLFQTLARLINRVDIQLQARDTVVSHSGAMLAARAQYEQGVPAYGMDSTVVLTGSSTATVYNVAIPIYRFLPRSSAPLTCADDLRKLQKAVIEITWGNSDCSDFYTTPNSAVISAVTCRVEAQYLLDVPDNQGFLVRSLSEINTVYAATNSDLSQTLDNNTGLLYRSLAVASLVANVGSDAPLNNGKIKLNSASFVFSDQDGKSIQANNRSDFEQQNLITGFYYVPATFAGDVSQMINTARPRLTGPLDVHFDVTYTSGVHALRMSLETVRPLNVN